MDEELELKLRPFLTKFHRLILGFYIAYNILMVCIFFEVTTDVFRKGYIWATICGLIAILVFIITFDFKIIKNEIIRNIVVHLFIIVMAGNSFYMYFDILKMAYILLVIFAVFEYSLDKSLEDDRKLIFLIGLTCELAFEFVIAASVLKYTSLEMFLEFSVIVAVIAISSVMIYVQNKIKSYYEEKIFSKARLLEDVNKTNDQLVDTQIKIKRSNELLGIQKVKLEAAYNKINRINSEMGIINDIISMINQSKDIKELLLFITKSLTERLNMDVCGVIIYEGMIGNDNENIYVDSTYSDSFKLDFAKFIQSGSFPDESDDKESIIDNNVDNKRYDNLNTNLLGSILMIPLINEDNIIGKIYFGNSNFNYFKDDISYFMSLVTQLMIGIKNINLFNSLENMAVRDGLTGIYNRRKLNAIEADWIKKLDKNKDSLTSVLLDIDKFKNINDSYGHMFGDEAIKCVANLISDAIKNVDKAIVARYGGEEFVLLFNNVDFEEVCTLVRQLHENIKAKTLVHNGEDIHINVSIGIASFPKTCNDPKLVINRSDWSMYYSKQNGRGRITIDNPEVDKLRK